MRRLVFGVTAAGVAVLEVAVLIQVANLVGWWILPLLLATSLVGGWLVKREGVRTLASLRAALQAGRAPDAKLADTAVVLVGGLLVLLPGFVTDLLGVLVALPFTRPLAKRVLLAAFRGRLADLERTAPDFGAYGGPGTGHGDGGESPAGPIVQGRVVSTDEVPTDEEHPPARRDD